MGRIKEFWNTPISEIFKSNDNDNKQLKKLKEKVNKRFETYNNDIDYSRIIRFTVKAFILALPIIIVFVVFNDIGNVLSKQLSNDTNVSNISTTMFSGVSLWMLVIPMIIMGWFLLRTFRFEF